MPNFLSRALSNSRTSVVKAFQAFPTYIPTFGGGSAVPTQDNKGAASTRNLNNYISPVQLARVKQDVQSWREAMSEAENAWYPQRVKMQRLFLDTILNGHVSACMDRRIKMTLLKPYNICKPRGADGKPGEPDPKLTKLFQAKWFKDLMRYALEAPAFGYSLVYLDNLIMDAFPKLSEIRRFNVSPDRLNVTQFVYSISGAPFTEEPFADWHIWIDTPTDVGTSKCGFGYLYKVALYEIIARNVIGFNTDATEMYGMPVRVGKTNKREESVERAIFEAALANLGSAGYLLMDLQGDEVELMESKSLGQGYKIYESLEKRCEAKISKLILGHADAMDSVPGKLGAQDDKDSPVNKAMAGVQSTDMDSFTDLANNQVIPKLRNLGFIIPDGYEFVYSNDDELKQERDDEDKSNLATAQIFMAIKTAGGDADWDYFTERTGIPVTATPPPPPPVIMGAPGGDKGASGGTDSGSPVKDGGNKATPPKKAAIDPKTKAKLEKLYSQHRHNA